MAVGNFLRLGKGKFRKKISVFGVSFFREASLEVFFLERSGDRYLLLGKEQFTMSQPLSQQAVSAYHSKLSGYRTKAPVWVHVILRHSAFVKLFSLSGIRQEDLDGEVAKRIREEIPYLAEELSYHYS